MILAQKKTVQQFSNLLKLKIKIKNGIPVAHKKKVFQHKNFVNVHIKLLQWPYKND